jgi:chemotaxis protein methyltransferase CheR
MERSVQQHDFAAAETVLDRISDRQERAATRLKYVRALLGGSEIARARRMLAACLAEEPLSVAAQLLAGTFAEEAGDVAAAEQAYRRALYVDRNSAIAHFHLALVQRQRGDAAGSRRSLEIVQRLARGQDAHARVEHGDGTCYGRLRELADTLVDFQAAAAGEVR